MHCFILIVFKVLILFSQYQNFIVNGVPTFSPAAFKALAIEKNWRINPFCQNFYATCTSQLTDELYFDCIDNFPAKCLLPLLTTNKEESVATTAISSTPKGKTTNNFDNFMELTSTIISTSSASSLKSSKMTELIPQSSTIPTFSNDPEGTSSSQISSTTTTNPSSFGAMVTSIIEPSAKNSKNTPMDTTQSKTVSPNLMIKTTEEAGTTQRESDYSSSLKSSSETAKMVTLMASDASTLSDKTLSSSESQDRVSTKSSPLTTYYPEHDTSDNIKTTTLPLDLTTTQPLISSSSSQESLNTETDDAGNVETSTTAMSSTNSPTRLSTSESASSHLSTESVPRTSQPTMTSLEISQNEKTTVAAEKSSSSGSSHSHSLFTELPIDHEKVSSSQVNSFTTIQDATSLLPSTSMKTSFSVSTVDEDHFTTIAKPNAEGNTMAETVEVITTLTSQSGSTVTDSQSQTLSSLAQSPSLIELSSLTTGSTVDVEEATSKRNTLTQTTMAETSKNSIKINELATTLMVTSGEPTQTTSGEFSSSQSTIVSSSLKPVESSANSPTVALDEIKISATTSSSSPISWKDTTTFSDSWTTGGMKATTLLPHISVVDYSINRTINRKITDRNSIIFD